MVKTEEKKSLIDTLEGDKVRSNGLALPKKVISEEEKQKLLEQQHEFYAFLPVLFEIVKECKNRTIDFLSSKYSDKKFGVRYFYSRNVNYLKRHLESVGVSRGNKFLNVYRSNALLKNHAVRLYTYNPKERTSDPEYVEFDKNYFSLIESFDLTFDIDSPLKDTMDSYKIAKEVKFELDEYKVPYYVKNSGSKGFHFVIPAQYMPNISVSELINMINKVVTNFREIHMIKQYIDLSVLNPKGLLKCAYSFDSSSGCVSLPLNDYEFDNFSVEKTKMDYVLKNVHLMNRGLKMHTHNLSEEQLKDNLKRFLEEYK
jgi:hypothetical protein